MWKFTKIYPFKGLRGKLRQARHLSNFHKISYQRDIKIVKILVVPKFCQGKIELKQLCKSLNSKNIHFWHYQRAEITNSINLVRSKFQVKSKPDFQKLPNSNFWQEFCVDLSQCSESYSYYRVTQNKIMAITLKLCICDPILVKPKYVWEACNFFIFSCLFTIFSCLFTNSKSKCKSPKRILALPTWG